MQNQRDHWERYILSCKGDLSIQDSEMTAEDSSEDSEWSGVGLCFVLILT